MLGRAIIAIFLSLFTLVQPAELFAQERRVALVIGNATYRNTPTLRNPSNDAEDIAAALQELGFDVITVLNLDYEGMRHAVLQFSRKMEGADVGLLFYAGHGIQVSEQNYLVPVDAQVSNVRDIDLQLMELDKVFAQMERETNTRIIILDACRDNPFASTMTLPPASRQRRLVGRGLSEISGLAGTFVAFATRPGQVALDGDGRNSPFSRALKTHIRKPGMSISDMMADVRSEVVSATKQGQIPWDMSSLTSPFYFNRADPQPGIDRSPGSAKADDIAARPFWDHVRAANKIEAYELFVRAFANSSYAQEAKAIIEQLRQASLKNPATDRTLTQPLTRNITQSAAVTTPPGASSAPGRGGSQQAGSSETRPKRAFRDCDRCPLMTPIDAGTFLMGSTLSEEGRQKNEGPQREVRITRPFAVSVYEVTIAEYEACVQANKCAAVAGKTASPSPTLNAYLDQQRAVANVSWEDARNYTLWLSSQTGWQYQLPSEAEWEYVTRAGSNTRYSWGDVATSADVYCADCADDKKTRYSTVIGQHQPNAFGLHDVHGNLWEWIADCWHHTYRQCRIFPLAVAGTKRWRLHTKSVAGWLLGQRCNSTAVGLPFGRKD
jgi:formylglycine-generating enzyme required for sulfatase activity